MVVVSPFLTFPNISWWMQVAEADVVLLDKCEHFQKMTWRNRYTIPGANNVVLLTVPLINGRNQHTPMNGVKIFNDGRWQLQHWRTIVSAYKRSPFFDHYEDSLHKLFDQQFEHLTDFNLASTEWARKQLKLQFGIEETEQYVKQYPPDIKDLRNEIHDEAGPPKYYQVFEDRIGFQPDMSILDLLFSEGPGAGERLVSRKS